MDLSCFFDDQYVFGTVCKDIEELFQRVVLGLVVSDVAESELVVDGHGVFIGTFIEDVSSQTLVGSRYLGALGQLFQLPAVR